MANYVSLDEAAKILRISPEELVQLRSRGDISGYRDGASWKFKSEEIQRAKDEMAGVLDEPAEGSSILLSEREMGAAGSKKGSTIGGDGQAVSSDSDSDLKLTNEDAGSDVALVHDPSSGSGVRLVNRSAKKPNAKDSSPELKLSDDSSFELPLSEEGSSGLNLSAQHDSDVLGGSDIKLTSGSGGGTGDMIHGDSDPNIGSSGSLNLDDDLEMADDDEDDLVLSSGSDLALGTDSGINLMSPSDSGLSLEDEPLDLAGTGISGLDLAGEGSDVKNDSDSKASGSGSLVDFQQDEEFQLSPSGGIEAEDDSGSQVIELEDSTDFGDAAVALPSDGFGGMDDFGSPMDMGGDGLGMETGATAGAVATLRGTPEIPYKMWEVACLLGILLVFGLSGIFVTDMVRNMWSWSGNSSITSSFAKVVIDSLGMK